MLQCNRSSVFLIFWHYYFTLIRLKRCKHLRDHSHWVQYLYNHIWYLDVAFTISISVYVYLDIELNVSRPLKRIMKTWYYPNHKKRSDLWLKIQICSCHQNLKKFWPNWRASNFLSNESNLSFVALILLILWLSE